MPIFVKNVHKTKGPRTPFLCVDSQCTENVANPIANHSTFFVHDSFLEALEDDEENGNDEE